MTPSSPSVSEDRFSETEFTIAHVNWSLPQASPSVNHPGGDIAPTSSSFASSSQFLQTELTIAPINWPQPRAAPSVNHTSGGTGTQPSPSASSSKFLQTEPTIAPINWPGRDILPLSPSSLNNRAKSPPKSQLAHLDLTPSSPPSVDDWDIHVDFNASTVNTSTPKPQEQSDLSSGYCNEVTLPTLQDIIYRNVCPAVPTHSCENTSPPSVAGQDPRSSSLDPSRQHLCELHTTIEDDFTPPETIVNLDSRGYFNEPCEIIPPATVTGQDPSSSLPDPSRQLQSELHMATEDILDTPPETIANFDSSGRLVRNASLYRLSSSSSSISVSMSRKRKSPDAAVESPTPSDRSYAVRTSSSSEAEPVEVPRKRVKSAPETNPKVHRRARETNGKIDRRSRKTKGKLDRTVSLHDPDIEMSDEGDVVISKAERQNLVYELTREKARHLAQEVTIPEDSDLGNEEERLFLDLATRGCKPLMSGHWQKDFSTLPESLFATGGSNDSDNGQLIFETLRGSDFGAIRALQELLKIGGHVRDCKFLPARPQMVIQKAIQKYLRWAVNDAGLRTGPTTIPVHTVYAQKPGESTLSAVTRLTKKLETLARRHQASLGSSGASYWPTLIGFVLCGPIVALVSLDTDPHSTAWTEDIKVKVKYLGQFDLSEEEQDVWNSMVVAISVIHIRNIMERLAKSYSGSCVPHFASLGDESEDEDL